MKTHEILGEVTELSAATTKTKQNGDSYKIANITVKQFNGDRSFLHCYAYNNAAESIGNVKIGDVVIVQFEISSKRNDKFWNTYVKATSVTIMPSPPKTNGQPADASRSTIDPAVENTNSDILGRNGQMHDVTQSSTPQASNAYTSINAVKGDEGKLVQWPEVDISKHPSYDNNDEFERMMSGYNEPEKPSEPEKPETTFPSVLRKTEETTTSTEQVAEVIKKLGPDKFAELLLNAQKQ